MCHTSEHPLSCLDYKLTRIQQRYTYDTDVDLLIDVDGSGRIAPFMVKCRFGSAMENMNVTELEHYNMGEIIVKGYKVRIFFIP